MKPAAPFFVLLALAGCATPPQDIGHAPAMSAVGSGLQADVSGYAANSFPAPPRSSPQSLWDDDRANLFRDPRAMRVGDVLTVTMDMDEKATLGNNTDLKNEATVGNGFDLTTGLGSQAFKIAPQFDLKSSTEFEGHVQHRSRRQDPGLHRGGRDRRAAGREHAH